LSSTHQSTFASILALYKSWSEKPYVNFLFLLAGIVTAMVLAPVLRQDIRLVAGGELILLALVRFLLNRQIRWFFWALLLTAICIPITGGTSVAIYGGSIVEMIGIGALVGVPLAGVALWGLRWTRQPREVPEEPTWFKRFEWFFEGAVWIMVFTLSQGQWSPFALASVATGAVFFALGSFFLLVVRLGLGRKGISNMFSIVGGVALVLCVILVLTQNGRVSVEEALVPGVIGAVFLAIGAAIRLFGGSDPEHKK
jgi:hypothetical protein